MATNTKNVPADDDEVLDASDIVVARRGRKPAPANEALVAKFRALKPGNALALKSTFGPVEKGNARQTVSQNIRKAWREAHPEGPDCRIAYHPMTMVPQVSFAAEKAAK